MSYALVREAVIERASLTAIYENYIRYFSPNAIGKHENGVPLVVAFQYGGGREGGLPSTGAWCVFLLPRLHYMRRNGDKWIAGPLEGMPIGQVAHIDIDA